MQLFGYGTAVIQTFLVLYHIVFNDKNSHY